jgi:hypothetical protein
MAKVEINESIIQLQHEGEGADETEKKEEKDDSKESKSGGGSSDVDTLVDLCVERVWDLLKAKYER